MLVRRHELPPSRRSQVGEGERERILRVIGEVRERWEVPGRDPVVVRHPDGTTTSHEKFHDEIGEAWA